MRIKLHLHRRRTCQNRCWFSTYIHYTRTATLEVNSHQQRTYMYRRWCFKTSLLLSQSVIYAMNFKTLSINLMFQNVDGQKYEKRLAFGGVYGGGEMLDDGQYISNSQPQ